MKKRLQIFLPILIIGLLVGLYIFKNNQVNIGSVKPVATQSEESVSAEQPAVQSQTEAPAQAGTLEMIDEYDLAAWKAEKKPLLIEFSTDS